MDQNYWSENIYEPGLFTFYRLQQNSQELPEKYLKSPKIHSHRAHPLRYNTKQLKQLTPKYRSPPLQEHKHKFTPQRPNYTSQKIKHVKTDVPLDQGIFISLKSLRQSNKPSIKFKRDNQNYLNFELNKSKVKEAIHKSTNEENKSKRNGLALHKPTTQLKPIPMVQVKKLLRVSPIHEERPDVSSPKVKSNHKRTKTYSQFLTEYHRLPKVIQSSHPFEKNLSSLLHNFIQIHKQKINLAPQPQ